MYFPLFDPNSVSQQLQVKFDWQSLNVKKNVAFGKTNKNIKVLNNLLFMYFGSQVIKFQL